MKPEFFHRLFALLLLPCLLLEQASAAAAGFSGARRLWPGAKITFEEQALSVRPGSYHKPELARRRLTKWTTRNFRKAFPTFGDLVLHVRDRNEMTQDDVRQELGVTQPHISMLEHNRVPPSRRISNWFAQNARLSMQKVWKELVLDFRPLREGAPPLRPLKAHKNPRALAHWFYTKTHEDSQFAISAEDYARRTGMPKSQVFKQLTWMVRIGILEKRAGFQLSNNLKKLIDKTIIKRRILEQLSHSRFGGRSTTTRDTYAIIKAIVGLGLRLIRRQDWDDLLMGLENKERLIIRLLWTRKKGGFLTGSEVGKRLKIKTLTRARVSQIENMAWARMLARSLERRSA